MKRTKEEKVEHYGLGWIDGASGNCKTIGKYQMSDEYIKGMTDGVSAFRAAMDKIRKELDCPLTSQAF